MKEENGYVIDRSKCLVPEGYGLYKATLTYGAGLWHVYASARTEKEAKVLVKRRYDYLEKALKILSMEFVSDDHDKEYDQSKMLLFGKVTVLEKRYAI